MKILLAEDDRDMAMAVKALLTRANYAVDHVENGQDALDYLEDGDYDAAIMDIMMPVMDGLTALKRARQKGIQVPVLMLTAMGELDDRVRGLDAGADDYLPKPFEGPELLARLRALLRRREGYQPDLLEFEDLTLDKGSFVLACGKNSVTLQNRAYQMMEMFLSAPKRVISAEEFMDHIWGWESDTELNVVRVNISTIRRQLEKIGSRVTIRVIRSAGYRLEDSTEG